MKLSKTQLHKIGSSGFQVSGRLTEPLLKTKLPLWKNVLKSAASATGATIHKKMFAFGMTTLLILNEEMNDNKKATKSLKKQKMKQKNKKVDFSLCY